MEFSQRFSTEDTVFCVKPWARWNWSFRRCCSLCKARCLRADSSGWIRIHVGVLCVRKAKMESWDDPERPLHTVRHPLALWIVVHISMFAVNRRRQPRSHSDVEPTLGGIHSRTCRVSQKQPKTDSVNKPIAQVMRPRQARSISVRQHGPALAWGCANVWRRWHNIEPTLDKKSIYWE